MLNGQGSQIKINHGKSCYLFGDGPSIRYLNYRDFTDKPVICCGNQLFHREYNFLNVVAYVIIEPRLFWPSWLLKSIGKKFLYEHWPVTKKYVKFFSDGAEKILYINKNNLPFTLGKYNYLSKKYFFSRGALCASEENIVNPIGGSFSACISLAINLGYEEIVLVGFDAFGIRKSPYRWYHQQSESLQLVEPDNTAEECKLLDNFRRYADIYVLQVSERSTGKWVLRYRDLSTAKVRVRSMDEIILHDDRELLLSVYG